MLMPWHCFLNRCVTSICYIVRYSYIICLNTHVTIMKIYLPCFSTNDDQFSNLVPSIQPRLGIYVHLTVCPFLSVYCLVLTTYLHKRDATQTASSIKYSIRDVIQLVTCRADVIQHLSSSCQHLFSFMEVLYVQVPVDRQIQAGNLQVPVDRQAGKLSFFANLIANQYFDIAIDRQRAVCILYYAFDFLIPQLQTKIKCI